MLSFKQSKFYQHPTSKQTQQVIFHLPMSTEEQASQSQPQDLNLQDPPSSPKQEASSSSPQELSERTSFELTEEQQFKKIGLSDELRINLLDISQINSEDTQDVPVFNYPPEDKSERDTLQVLKRRRPPNNPFYRGRYEHNDATFYNNRRNSQFQRPKSHKKPFREEERFHHKSYQHEEYDERGRDRESGRYAHNSHICDEDNRYNQEQRDYYKQSRRKEYPSNYQEDKHLTPGSRHYNTHSSQYYKPNQNYYQGGAVQGWNGSAWINYMPVNYAQTSTPLILHNYGICLPHHYQQYLLPLQPPQHYYANPPTKDNSPPKQQLAAVLPSPFADICLPKFQITVKNCCISVNYCSTSRLQADLMVLLHGSQNFDCYPSYKIEDHFNCKEEGEKTIKEALKGHKDNGTISFVKTQKSQFKALAFMKVCSPSSNAFTSIFNRGLANLFAMGAPTVRSVVVPYNDNYGSSKEKAKQLVELMKAGPRGFEQIVINCSDLHSFRRMVDGFSSVVSQMEAEITV